MKILGTLLRSSSLALFLSIQPAEAPNELSSEESYHRFIGYMEKLYSLDEATMRLVEEMYAASGEVLGNACAPIGGLDTLIGNIVLPSKRIFVDTRRDLRIAEYLALAALYRVHSTDAKPAPHTALEVPLLAHYDLLDRQTNKVKPAIREIAQGNSAILTHSRCMLFLERQ